MISKEKLEMYEELAKRNKWSLIFEKNDKNERPYFYKDGDYAIPDEETNEEDKRLLAEIISEGSEELANLLITCWDNNLNPSGPCSGIREFHNEPPAHLHFGVTGSDGIIYPLYEAINVVFSNIPGFEFLVRETKKGYRFDLFVNIEGKDISKEDSNAIFKIINERLNEIIKVNKDTEDTNFHK